MCAYRHVTTDTQSSQECAATVSSTMASVRMQGRILAAATVLAFVAGVLHASYFGGIGACETKHCLCTMHCCLITSALPSRTIGSSCRGENPGTAITEDAEDAASVAVAGNATVSPDAITASLPANSNRQPCCRTTNARSTLSTPSSGFDPRLLRRNPRRIALQLTPLSARSRWGNAFRPEKKETP